MVWTMASAVRVAYRYLKAAEEPNPLDGMSRRKVMALVNKVIDRSHLKGFFSDPYWRPVKSLWKNFDQAGISYVITSSDYETERVGEHLVPVRKVWRF